MNTDLNKKTVKELRQRARELHEMGELDETLTEITRARKAELIEWIEFYDDEDEDSEESVLENQAFEGKTRTAIQSFPDSERNYPSISEVPREEEPEKTTEIPEASETLNTGVGKQAIGEVLMLILVGLLTLSTAIGLGYIFR